MKTFIAVFCIIAVTSTGYSAPSHYNTAIGPHGVPLESAENVAARAYHQAAHSKAVSFHHNAAAQAAPWVEDAHNEDTYGNSAWAGADSNNYAHAEPVHQWTGPQHQPVIGHNGVPVDTHENNARRTLHQAAYAKALARGGNYASSYNGAQEYGASHNTHAEHVRQWTGPQHLTVIGHNGVPVDTSENNARRAFHHSAYAEAISRSGKYSGDHDATEGQSGHTSAGWSNQNSYSNKNQW